jgi:hypothetical protein
MNNKIEANKENNGIAGLLDVFLKTQNSNSAEPHLDHDTLNALVEGRLNRVEAKPITTHLVKCSFCRHVTAELVKLELAFSDDLSTTPTSNAEPTKVSEVIAGLFSRLFGSPNGEVFAHQEPEEDEGEKSKTPMDQL